jgi:UPF0716 protein FxsA
MKLRFLLVAYPLAEISAAYGVASLIGWPWTIALLIAGMPIGWMITKRAGQGALQEMTEIIRIGDMPAMRDLGLVPAGLLIMVPGFVTDLLGAVLCVPQVRRAMWGRRMPNPAGQVIEGQIIDKRDEPID